MHEMRHAGDALRALLVRAGLDRQLRTYDALAAWSAIVGTPIAQVARPIRIDAHTLWVAVKSHAWAQELNFQKRTILARLNERAGEQRFREIRFIVQANWTAPALYGQDARATESGLDSRVQAVASVSPPTMHGQDCPCHLHGQDARATLGEVVSDSELAQIESSLAQVEDLTLRDALMRAQIVALCYQKYLAQLGWRRCVVCGCYHSDAAAVCSLCEQGI